MVIFIIILSISIALTLTSSFLYFFERIKTHKLRKIIISESINISEKLGKTAFGLLNQKLESKISDISFDKEIYNNFNNIIKNFNELTNDPIKRICFVGSDAWLEGGNCADIIGKQLNNKGKIAVLVTSNLNTFIMSQRYRSFVNKINKSYPDINIIKTFEANTKQENAKEFTNKISKDVDAIYITGNSIVMGAVQGLEEAGYAGKVFVLCHDLDSNISLNIQKGVISASLVCSTITQGRDPIIHLFNYINSGWKPKQPRLSVPLELADKKNINKFWDFSDNCLVELKDQIKNNVKPLHKSNSKIRIIVLTEDWNTAFQQIKSGSELAKKLLEPFNVEVVLYSVNQLQKNKDEALNEIKYIIQNEKMKKIDGIVAFIGYQEIVTLLNEQYDDGVPIATFNAEPIGLRSMILWLTQSSVELEKLSNEYTYGHQEINISVQQILSTFNKMVGQIYHETESVKEGAKAVNELLTLIDNTVTDEEHQLKTISSTSEITFNLSEMVKFFNGKVTGLKTISDNVKISEEKITVMKNYTNQIISIINIIDSITKQTNLLAINASIEASRTGESGKGFHVIAKEIRELASKSDASTKDVTILINNIVKSINESSEAIELTKFIVNDQAVSIANAIEKINDLSKSLIDTMKSIQNVVEENTQKMMSMKNHAYNMNTMIENNALISTENSKAIETISSAFTQISAQFNDMNNKTKELGDIVLVLYNTVSQFSAK